MAANQKIDASIKKKSGSGFPQVQVFFNIRALHMKVGRITEPPNVVKAEVVSKGEIH